LNLEYANYSHNVITTIENTSKNKYLKSLILSHNQISKIEKLSENVYLEVIKLKYNYLILQFIIL